MKTALSEPDRRIAPSPESFPRTRTPSGLPLETRKVPDLRPSVSEFLAALGDPLTYHPGKNGYTLFGFLWGFPLSVLSIVIDMWVIGHPYRLTLFWSHPVHLLFFVHPFLFGIIFGAMGSVRHRKDLEIHALVSEAERRSSELGSAYEKLKELDRHKAEFMANVTHELKTPLVSIRGYTEAILEGRFGPTTPKQHQGLVVAARNIGRLQKLIDELLEFERIDSGGFQLSVSDFDLTELVHQVLETFRPMTEQKRLLIELRIPPHLRVTADREKIRRVFINLVSNAVKFSGEGGEIGVHATVEPGSRVALLTVYDHGPGIPTDAQQFLFTRFWQADGSAFRKPSGTGLGLAIVKGLLEAHGSKIHAVSSPGAGTMMHFELPLAGISCLAEEDPHDPTQAAHPDRG